MHIRTMKALSQLKVSEILCMLAHQFFKNEYQRLSNPDSAKVNPDFQVLTNLCVIKDRALSRIV